MEFYYQTYICDNTRNLRLPLNETGGYIAVAMAVGKRTVEY